MGQPPAARTALGPMFIVAVEQYLPVEKRLVHDPLASRLLPLGLRLAAQIGRWPGAHDWMATAVERKAPGIWGGVLCRKRYIDDKVREAVATGVRQLVVLGAGLDTRAHRFAAEHGVRAFDVDLPANIEAKRRRLAGTPESLRRDVALVRLDFESDDLGQCLARNGFGADQAAVFVWEAVTQYLTEDAVRRTLRFLGTAASGSRLVFTYVRGDFLAGTYLYDAEPLYRDFVVDRQAWRFGLHPEEVDGLLRQHGWAEREQVGADDYLTRYLHPRGRSLPVSEIERCVHAERR
ncbi:class I SAM-dependent methyltransferase [Streptoalloteichus hindustanus]|uniref:S-adenosyl-L-methionine-dependent methyltransferase n=1 Tax=Streptoalloteichus hindustanus TaxID=2017 RepID=A0A1M5IF71_STRHI|nr:class I SAM-dependent methyltransferase [Streptoalloteichus hindustanus]SHG26885.1 methyltransferase, TIGR00027 family [Streptoalloteichus hindustanus]